MWAVAAAEIVVPSREKATIAWKSLCVACHFLFFCHLHRATYDSMFKCSLCLIPLCLSSVPKSLMAIDLKRETTCFPLFRTALVFVFMHGRPDVAHLLMGGHAVTLDGDVT